MKLTALDNDALIAHIIDWAEDGGPDVRLDMLAELVHRFEKLQRWFDHAVTVNDTVIEMLEKCTQAASKIPQADDGNYRRLAFLEMHVKELNGRINAAATEAHREGYARGFREGVTEGKVRTGDLVVSTLNKAIEAG